MSTTFTEADYENSIIELFQNMGYQYVYGPDIERDFYSPLYKDVLMEYIHRLNPSLPEEAISAAMYKLQNYENGDLVQKNEVFMDYIQHGIPVRYTADGELCSSLAYIVDYKNVDNNSFIVANQWTFIENSNKRPDIILFINGLPVVLIELKSPSREETDASEGYLQIRNYIHEIPSMFIYNCISVISDQLTSKAGTITSGEDRFMEWKTKDGNYENTQYAQFDTFFEGMFDRARLLDIIKNFICFSDEGLKKYKILAGYHQYFAVNKAVQMAKKATVTAYNSEMSDKPFMVKMEMEGGFKESALRLNSYLVKLTEWNENHIKERAKLLSDKAKEVWEYPKISEEELAPYCVEEKPTQKYSLDTYDINVFTKTLFEVLDKRIMNLSSDVKREYKKLYIAYKLDTNFVDVIVQKQRLRISVNMKFSEIHDPKGICKDITGLGRWGNGDVELFMEHTSDVDNVMEIIEQSYRMQAE